MGYSKDPAKRRRQLEALARNNPTMDVEALMNPHDESVTPSADPPASRSQQDTTSRPDEHGSEPPRAAPSGVLEIEAADADVVRQEGQLIAIFWADGADEEHPTLGVPLTDEAAIALADGVETALDLKDDVAVLGSVFEVMRLHVRDLDRTRMEDGMVARDEEPGRVQLTMTATDDREVDVLLGPECTSFLRRWLRPGYFEAPMEEFVVIAEPSRAPSRETSEAPAR